MCSTLLTILLAVGTQAEPESGELFVVFPSELVAEFPNGQIDMRPAMFGVPALSGQKITGLVLYTPNDDLNACASIDKSELDWPDGGAVIMMLDRGNCTFVTKVRHAQQLGAQAAIIVDNKDELGIPYMADDHTGTDIQIPSMLIHKNDGAKIKIYVDEETSNAVPVVMSMVWDYANKDNRVEWEIWSSTNMTTSMNFKRSFRPAVEALGANALFTPHLLLPYHSRCYVSGASSPDDLPGHCAESCINQGRYCGNSPASGVPGYLGVQEFVRSLCVWKEVVDIAPATWFEYESQVSKVCSALSESCTYSVMNGLGVSANAVRECVTNSGGTGRFEASQNKILDNERRLQIEKAILFDPTILINDFRYTGSLNCQPHDASNPLTIDRSSCGVLNSICLGFLDESVVTACESSPGCPIGQIADEAGVCNGHCVWDSCDKCLELDNPSFNKTCIGCDGVPHSGKKEDACKVCDGPGIDKCGRCSEGDDYIDPESDFDCDSLINGTNITDTEGEDPNVPQKSGLKTWVVVLLAVGVPAVVILLAVIVLCVHMKHKQAKFRDEMANYLDQYNRMDAGSAQPSGRVETQMM